MQKKDINNLDQFFIEEFKKSCIMLEKNLLKHPSKINIRRETHDNEVRKEILFEIVVLNFTNEDDYGIVFSLIMESQKVNPFKSIELSVIRGNGAIIELRNFDASNEIFKNRIKFEEEFKQSLNQYVSIILKKIENEYLDEVPRSPENG